MRNIMMTAGAALLTACAGAVPTVTVDAFNASTGSYTLSIGARTAPTWLYAVAAADDKGATTEGWESVSPVGEYAAGEALVVNRVLPRNFTIASKKVRFIAAEMPGTRVEYLTSSFKDASNGSYIDTGIVPDYTTDITIDCRHTATSASFGVLTVFYLFGSNTSGMFYGYFGNQDSTTSGGNSNARNTLRLCPEGAYKDGDFLVGPLNAKSTSTELTATLFARRQAAGTIGKAGIVTIWSASISKGGRLERDYVPYVDAEGKGFLFDRVTKTPFVNQMPDYPFAIGPAVKPELADAKAFSASAVQTTSGAAVSATVSGLTLTQVGSRRLKVTYTLDNAADPVIVTARMLTNGVAVAGANLFGAVGTELTNGEHVFYWHSDDDIPNLATGGVRPELKLWHTDAPPAYLVFDLRAQAKPRHYEAEIDLPGGIGSDVYRTTRLVMRRVNARGMTFRMGSPVEESVGGVVRHATGEETRYVTFSEDFYMGVFEFTQGQFRSAATNANPSAFKLATDNQYLGRPLENFSYNRFHSSYRRSEHPGHGVHETSIVHQLRTVTQSVIDLPTEAQWEYACRAGTATAFHWGTDGAASHSRNNGNPSNNTVDNWRGREATCAVGAGGTARVGSYAPNAWGFYDMSGNVWEMCVDSWSAGPFDQNTVETPLVDPLVEDSSSNDHVRRGGGWGAATYSGRSAVRSSCQDANNSVGFRLVCPVPHTKAWEK